MLVGKHCICSWSLRMLGEVGFSEDSEGASCRDVWEMTLDWYWYHTSHIMGLWEITTCMYPMELRSSQAPRVILIGKSASSRGCHSSAHAPVNPCGAGGNLLHTVTNSAKQAAPLGSEASCLLGAGRVVGSSSQLSGFFSSDEALSVRTGGVKGSFSATFNMVISNRLPLLNRGTRHLWSPWTALQSITGGIPDCMAHCWRAWASTTISSHLTIWMSQGPWNSIGGRRKSFHLNTPRQGGVLHQLLFSSWARGSLKATAYLLDKSWTWVLLRGSVPWQWIDWNFHHQ